MGRAAKCDGRGASTIALNRLEQTYTRDALDSTFDRLKRNFVENGKIRDGLTFHYLRKSLGAAAADIGFSETDIAGAHGQANGASARPFVVETSRRFGAERVFEALSKRK